MAWFIRGRTQYRAKGKGRLLAGVYVWRAYMLWAEAASDDDRRDELQRAPTDDFGNGDRGQVAGQIGFDRPVLDENLTGLDDSGGQLATALNLGKICVGHSTFA